MCVSMRMSLISSCSFSSTSDTDATVSECVSLCPNHHHTSCPHYDHAHLLHPHAPHYPQHDATYESKTYVEEEHTLTAAARRRPRRTPPSRTASRSCSCGGVYRCIPRTLELRTGDMFECGDVSTADIVICETKVPEAKYRELCRFLARCKTGEATQKPYNKQQQQHNKYSSNTEQHGARRTGMETGMCTEWGTGAGTGLDRRTRR